MAFSFVTQALREMLNQFNDRPNMARLFSALSPRFDDTAEMLDSLYVDRWLDTAGGVWLDAIGKIVGMERLYEQLNPENVFTYRGILDPNVPTKGYGSAAGPPGIGGVYTGIHGLFTDTPISDTDYRGWIRWKIQTRNEVESIPSIYRFIDDRFMYSAVITVPQPGLVQVDVSAAATASELFLMRRFMPLASGIDLDLRATLG